MRRYEALFLIEADYRGIQSSDARNFDLIWKERSARDYGKPYLPNQLMTPVPASSYSAIVILAQVRRSSPPCFSWRSLSHFGVFGRFWTSAQSRQYIDLTDGAALARHFHNRSFAVPTGNVYLDSTGTRSITRQLEEADQFYPRFPGTNIHWLP
ncbi:hypothetical protein RvY_02148-2 [Ramazzottius varieornatus]|uniref:Uncharacterized protein n=1 Tax=Ramazzottius varieornatus TaxID=947166 RepID=A0A1D1UQR6_RAMVA|nr:hypothetical protein RvY_02148-2 [Ramazzottius varieornatus]